MPKRKPLAVPVSIPDDLPGITMTFPGKEVKLTNLKKIFWPELGLTKRHLLEYYAAMANVLLPHLVDRAMVMKRYPDGIHGKNFFMKRTPDYKPDWLEMVTIEHGTGTAINYPIVQDIPSLLWVINLGCIDLNQWYARCDDVTTPDYLHFDLDPVKETSTRPATPFERVCEAALVLRVALEAMDIPAYPKTTGSRGIHVYIPIERGPSQSEVHAMSKAIAQALAAVHKDLLTVEYNPARRDPGKVLVDYNQNGFGRTLASVYSIRPTPEASVSAPVTWEEIESGIAIADFRIDTMVNRVNEVGDLHKPVVHDQEPRVSLGELVKRFGG